MLKNVKTKKMTKQELQEQTNQILRELRDLHNQLDILQDDVEIEAEGCTDEESEKRQDFKDMAGQILRGKDTVSEAIDHLEWIV